MSFRPLGNASLAVTNSAAAVALPSRTLNDVGGTSPAPYKVLGNKMRLQNVIGGAELFFKTGQTPAVAATVNDTSLQPGSVETFNIPDGDLYISAITAASTATLRISVGGESNA